MSTGFRLGLALVAAGLVVAVPSAEAVTFRFADPGALSPNGTPDACFNGDDVCGPTLSWTLSGITVTASPLGSATAIIQDLYPNGGGLGAVHDEGGGSYSDPRGDEVNRGQGIRLTFSEPVHLRRVRFRNEDHEGHFGENDDDDDDENEGATFCFRSDDGAWHSRELEGVVGFGGLLGTSFDFKYGGSHPEDFYIARLRVEPEVEVPEPVPEPGTMALMGAGLLGLVSRARRRTRS